MLGMREPGRAANSWRMLHAQQAAWDATWRACALWVPACAPLVSAPLPGISTLGCPAVQMLLCHELQYTKAASPRQPLCSRPQLDKQSRLTLCVPF